jgi:hypothetical protein
MWFLGFVGVYAAIGVALVPEIAQPFGLPDGHRASVSR